MSSSPRFRLVLAKENFKFSVAHFTLFSPADAELLHGHNYRVCVELVGEELNDLGLLADVDRIKREIRRLCATLDSRTLIPAESPLLRVEQGDGGVEVAYNGRRYRFPQEDVLLLPLANSSMELLARYLWQGLEPTVAGMGLREMSVAVEESAGQRCVYERGL
jgi:6-pyruvoyltetrahydropterin/6-carboxytetrahydropterin synthase